jgi:hypothetical protein
MKTNVVNKQLHSSQPNANQLYIGRGSLFGNLFTRLPVSLAQLAMAPSQSPLSTSA